MLPDINSSSRHVWSDGIQAAHITLQHLLGSCHDFLIYHVFGSLKLFFFFCHYSYISSVSTKHCRNTQGQMDLDSSSYLNKHRHRQESGCCKFTFWGKVPICHLNFTCSVNQFFCNECQRYELRQRGRSTPSSV